MENILEIIKQPWPWYISGPLIGLMVPMLMLLDNKHFGVSSTFRDFCALVLPSKKLTYFNYNLKEHIWRNLFVFGILAGGVICNLFLNNDKPIEISQKTVTDLETLGLRDLNGLVPYEIFSWSGLMTFRGFFSISVGGFLVGFGTRYADGCTSGHAITGLSLLSASSLISVIGFFIGGVVSTYFLLPLIFNF